MSIFTHIISHIWELWVVVALACLIIEMMVIADGSLYVICFAIGAIVSAIASLFIDGIYTQILIWAVASVLSIFIIRPTLRRYFHHDKDVKSSNADAIIGRIGRVSEKIEEGGYGRVALDGDDWKALSSDGHAIEAGTKVKIISRDSIIVTVETA